MTKHVLLFEPFKNLADILVIAMAELGFTVEIGNSSGDGSELANAGRYACVFVNLDQNSRDWRSRGLMLATKASQLGLPVVMIPDNHMAREVIRANGFLEIEKPFKLEALKTVMERATWARDAVAGSA